MSTSYEVIKFLDSYRRLLEVTKGDVDVLIAEYHTDSQMREIASETAHAAFPIEIDEISSPDFIITPVSSRFIGQWRDYQKRFAPLLRNVVISIGQGNPEKLSYPKHGERDIWELADNCARGDVENLELIISLAEEEFENRKEFHQGLQIELDFDRGVEVLRKWLPGVGLDIRATMRRTALLEKIYVPSQVEAKSGKDATGLIAYYEQAQRAFLLGADFGSIIILRSTVEKALREHYQAEITGVIFENGQKKKVENFGLEELISNWKTNDILSAKVDKIRKLANNLVHGGGERRTKKILKEQKKFEMTMLGHFLAVRDLIEKAPR